MGTKLGTMQQLYLTKQLYGSGSFLRSWDLLVWPICPHLTTTDLLLQCLQELATNTEPQQN